jgi:hypothetical protein
MKRFILILLAIALSACTAAPKSELSRKRATWDSAHITNYRFSLFIGCFCVFRDRMPLLVEVRDGEVVSMTYSDGAVVPETERDFFNRFATIDKIFAELESGQASKADEVKVTYDATYGFPDQVNVDQIKNAMDDEYSLQISDFQVLN